MMQFFWFRYKKIHQFLGICKAVQPITARIANSLHHFYNVITKMVGIAAAAHGLFIQSRWNPVVK